MKQRTAKRRNWAILTVLGLVMLASLAIVILQFADPATKGQLYGWLPATAPATAPASPSNP